MKQFIKDLFSENSSVSMMRLMSLVSLLIGGYLAIKGKDASVIVFVTAAFGGKVIQKQIEKP
jgi:Na+(H+)/acetate symporter ActP